MENFRIDEALMEYDNVYYGFNLSKLYGFHKEIIKLRDSVILLKQMATKENLKKQVLKHEEQLFYLLGNIILIEDVMTQKEMDLFEENGTNVICVN